MAILVSVTPLFYGRSIKLQGMKLKQGFMSKRLIMKVKMRRRKM